MKSFLARAEPQDAGSLNIEQRFPFFGTNNIWNYSDNFSAILGSHSTKFGVFVEYGHPGATAATTTATSLRRRWRAAWCLG